jgi:hypothetical protein
MITAVHREGVSEEFVCFGNVSGRAQSIAPFVAAAACSTHLESGIHELNCQPGLVVNERRCVVTKHLVIGLHNGASFTGGHFPGGYTSVLSSAVMNSGTLSSYARR